VQCWCQQDRSDSQDNKSFITPFTMGIDLHGRGHVVWWDIDWRSRKWRGRNLKAEEKQGIPRVHRNSHIAKRSLRAAECHRRWHVDGPGYPARKHVARSLTDKKCVTVPVELRDQKFKTGSLLNLFIYFLCCHQQQVYIFAVYIPSTCAPTSSFPQIL
jgi:hypothetical protein